MAGKTNAEALQIIGLPPTAITTIRSTPVAANSRMAAQK